MLGDWIIVTGTDGNKCCFKYEDVAYIYQESNSHCIIYFKNNDQSCFMNLTIDQIMLEVHQQQFNNKLTNKLDQLIGTHNNGQ